MFLFDRLPVELIQNIFHYLWAHEILHAFTNQSHYLDSILNNYDRYSICLCSMLKNQFDQICQQIQPEQVLSLAIINEDDTPDQSKLFFSNFDIQQFTNLRSFAILSYDTDLFRKLDILCQLNRFQSVVFPDDYTSIGGWNIDTILLQLKRLGANQYVLTRPLKNLQHLIVPHCYCYKLEYFYSLMPNLHSLNINISLDIFPFWSRKIPTMNQMRQLILRIQYGRLTMGQINEVLTKLPRLIHFELELIDPMDIIGGEKWQKWIRHLNIDIEVAGDILDGNQWKYLVSHLQKFDFRFYFLTKPSKQILNSFQTIFWLEQKRWFVAYDDSQSTSCLFTVPRFAPKTTTYSLNYQSIPCTLSRICLEQFVQDLKLPILRSLTHDFTNVTSLMIETNENLDREKILPYLQMPNLRSLSFGNLTLLVKLSSEPPFKLIRILDVKTIVSKSDAEQICTIFPQIERLQIMIDDNETMLLVIDKLKHLSIVKFIYSQLSSMEAFTREWFHGHSLRLKTDNCFTYRINGNNVHLWMNSE